jgi:Uma2 family endonuclease
VSEPYEEIIGGETLLRAAPGQRHERICAWLHARMAAGLNGNRVSRLLTPRSVVQFGPGTILRPDLSIVTAATGKLFLAAEIVNSDDHRLDTVLKKSLYEEFKAPRLWMLDPRYDNVEIYHTTPYGLALKGILAGKETLNEALLPEFVCSVTELFAATSN